MKILLSNDDGVYARGIQVLRSKLERMGTVKVLAPMEEKSATGHSLSLSRPLRMVSIGKNVFGVNGSPADCIALGMNHVFKGKPDIVVSGINRGGNLGQDIFYSGTVSAAREGCIRGVPSFSVSLSTLPGSKLSDEQNHYATAAIFAAKIIRSYLGRIVPRSLLLNINVPNLPVDKIKGIRPVRQGMQLYNGAVLRRLDHRGKNYYWVARKNTGYRGGPDSDCVLVNQGYVTITPMRLDITDMDFLKEMSFHV